MLLAIVPNAPFVQAHCNVISNREKCALLDQLQFVMNV